MPALDHITVNVSDYARSKLFYERALAPLGIQVLFELSQACGMGRERPEFWIGVGPASKLLIGNRHCVVAGINEYGGRIVRQIFIQLKLQRHAAPGGK